jgi:hypothetical protein
MSYTRATFSMAVSQSHHPLQITKRPKIVILQNARKGRCARCGNEARLETGKNAKYALRNSL